MKSGDSVAPGHRRRWGRAILVAGQVAVSVVVLVVALFMYRGFGKQLSSGPGYRTDHLMIVRVDTSLVRYTSEQSAKFFKELSDRAREVPGVANATLSTSVPMSNDSIGAVTVAPDGYSFPPGKDNAIVFASRVDEHYFDVMGVSLLKGRNFAATDDAAAPKVAIVNEQFAKRYWPGQDPIGKRVRLVDQEQAWAEVVGMAKMSKSLFIAEPPTEFIYLPYTQNTSRQI